MHHHHFENHHGHIHHHHTVKNLKTALVLNSFFTVVEIVGGLLTNSMAILSDALHDLGDTMAIGLSWYFQKLSQKKRDARYSYGYGRLSLVSALINSLILLTGSAFIIYETIPRLLNPQPVHVPGMFLLAILGALVNGVAVWRLRRGKGANERMVYLHLMEDVLGWLAVLAGSVVMYFTGWTIIDPVLSLMIAAYILWNVFRNLKEFIRIFLQGIPHSVDLHQVEERIKSLPQVASVHDTHIWSMDGEYHVLSTHVVVPDDLDKQSLMDLKKQLRHLLHDFHIDHETIEFEYAAERCGFAEC